MLLGICVLVSCTLQAAVGFKASEISGAGSNLLTADLDGDGLKDLVLVDDTNLSIYYQDRPQGFTHDPEITYQLERRASVVWTARLGRQAESLVVMDSAGVVEMDFSNRTNPPSRRAIIRRPTILPDAAGKTNVMCLAMSAATGGEWPLILLPVAGGLEVWRHDGEWRQVQFM